MGTYYYITGRDLCVRRSGRTLIQDVFDGPHPDESTAHSVATSIIASGDYKIIESPYKNRDVARQTYNHDLSLSQVDGKPVGAAAAVQNKFRLQPKNDSQRAKDEKKAAWGQ